MITASSKPGTQPERPSPTHHTYIAALATMQAFEAKARLHLKRCATGLPFEPDYLAAFIAWRDAGLDVRAYQTGLSRDGYIALFSIICDSVERVYQGWPQPAAGELPDGFHTSDEAREAANRVMDAVADLRGPLGRKANEVLA